MLAAGARSRYNALVPASALGAIAKPISAIQTHEQEPSFRLEWYAETTRAPVAQLD
jgi:hypothetical protein